MMIMIMIMTTTMTMIMMMMIEGIPYMHEYNELPHFCLQYILKYKEEIDIKVTKEYRAIWGFFFFFNAENIILLFFENYFYSFVFFVFFKTKKH